MKKIISSLLFIFSLQSFAIDKPALKIQLTHMLNRLSFGPRANELELLVNLGAKSKLHWIEEQLNPEKIDDSSLEEKLRHIKSLDMEPRDIINFYKKPEELAKDLGLKVDQTDTNREIRKEVKEAIGNDRFPEALITELTTQKLMRAVESKKQLQEVLVDFWFNHFNVDVGKNEIKFFAYHYENDVIRKNIFKTFPEMLLASAHHPAMLVYLDNRLSRNKALNENYAREVMELHTLGADGGYTQKDVQELARILTGWGVKDLKENPLFYFNEKAHDKSDKLWLSMQFTTNKSNPNSSLLEGETALMTLALHPKTAEHICHKLVSYFIDETPPQLLATKCKETFLKSKGNLKEIYRLIFTSKEFWDPKYDKSKIKMPLALIASSVRALNGEILNTTDLQKSLKMMGEELYRAQPPTGFKDEASIWVSPGSMISRLQFALDLSAHKFSGVLISWPTIDRKKTLEKQIQSMSQSFGIGQLNAANLKIIKHELELETPFFANNEIKLTYIGKMSGMILGSPEFQRK